MKYLRLGLIKSRILNTECKLSQDPGMAVGIKHDTGFKQTNQPTNQPTYPNKHTEHRG